MNIVVQNLLSTFKEEQTLPSDLTESVIFEHFCNFLVLSKEYSEEFNLDDIHTGKGSDMAIDGIGILVNGSLVNDINEIEDLAKSNRYVEAEFIFIQAKNSSSFDGGDISNFLFGIRAVFNPKISMPRHNKIQSKIDLINFIYRKSTLLKRGNPKIKIYYVSTGKWQNDQNLLARVNAETQSLKDMNIFESVDFYPIDIDKIQELHRYAKNSISKTIDFENKVTIPEVEGIKEAYLGILPVTELINLLTDDNGLIIRGLFYDNVRDFQGNNEVNSEIQKTINSADKYLFVLLNNGVTVVADSINKTGNKFTVEGFQVVNGCQTSHVLYNNKNNLTRTMYIPIRLIVSGNDEIKNKIIKATNRQTPVDFFFHILESNTTNG